MYSNKSALLLDMNSTFMFGEDNFGTAENFFEYYHRIGGQHSEKEVNHIIKLIYGYLNKRYSDETYRNKFPTLKEAIKNVVELELSREEISRIVRTFAHHEIGNIPPDYIDVLHQLSQCYTLAVVTDIWAPKSIWFTLFKDMGIDKLFSAASFSSDHGMVKPSPKPFELVINQLGEKKENCLMIGDSVYRDLGGATAAGVDCVLVGSAKHNNALGCYKNLLELSQELLWK